MNISSVVVHAQSSSVDRVRGGLGALAGVEVHAASSEGRLIVTIETDSDQETVDAFEAIRQLDGVLSASLVYSHFESDPDSVISVEANPQVKPQLQGDLQ